MFCLKIRKNYDTIFVKGRVIMEWNEFSKSKDNYYHMLAMKLIQNDASSIADLVSTLNLPVIAMVSLPYLSLFCCSLDEYYAFGGKPISIKNSSQIDIKDLRLGLKQFDDKYSRCLKRITRADQIQDDYFKNELKLRFLKSCKAYYNIGLFFDEEGHIISNSQNVFNLFEDKHFSVALNQQNIIELGKSMGTVINSVKIGLDNTMGLYCPKVLNQTFIINYSDLHSDSLTRSFRNIKNGKALYLWLLHILCNINFVKYVICNITDEQNPWQFRLKYIVLYYTHRNIKTIADNTDNIQLRDSLYYIIGQIPKEIISIK